MSPGGWVLLLLLVVNGKAMDTERLGNFSSEAACLDAREQAMETQSYQEADDSWSIALALGCFPIWPSGEGR